jgi:hypothetical protein
MVFVYSNRAHVRKHGPAGYTDFTTYKPWLRDDFHFRCVYCLERERWYPSGHAAFSVEHVLPKGAPDNLALICAYENLVYACNRCNSVKQDHLLLDPCATPLAEHLRVSDDGSISGLTAQGQRLVRLLGLNKIGPRTIRQRCLRVLLLYQNNPDNPDIQALYLDYFGYPDDLPNLDELRPASNSRPEGAADCYWRQRAENRLPETYF